MEYARPLLFLTHLSVLLSVVVLAQMPRFLGWDSTSTGTVLCWGAASLILAGQILSLLTTWQIVIQRRTSNAELVKAVVERIGDLRGATEIGLVEVFLNRNRSLERQHQLLLSKNVNILGTTLNSLLAFRTERDPISVLQERLNDETWGLRVLLLDPRAYRGRAQLLDATQNAQKLLNRLQELVKRLSAQQLARLSVWWAQSAPSLFMIFDDEEVLLSHYDYGLGGDQPVFVFRNVGPNSLYFRYRGQFEQLLADAETKKLSVNEIATELRQFLNRDRI